MLLVVSSFLHILTKKRSKFWLDLFKRYKYVIYKYFVHKKLHLKTVNLYLIPFSFSLSIQKVCWFALYFLIKQNFVSKSQKMYTLINPSFYEIIKKINNRTKVINKNHKKLYIVYDHQSIYLTFFHFLSLTTISIVRHKSKLYFTEFYSWKSLDLQNCFRNLLFKIWSHFIFVWKKNKEIIKKDHRNNILIEEE